MNTQAYGPTAIPTDEQQKHIQEAIKKLNSESVATAYDLLEKARDTMRERGKQYDQPKGERSMAKVISAFNTISGNNLTEADGWLLMTILKQVRLFQNRDKAHADSYLDLIAYSALLGECAAQQGLNNGPATEAT